MPSYSCDYKDSCFGAVTVKKDTVGTTRYFTGSADHLNDGVTSAQAGDIATTDGAVTKLQLQHSRSSWLPACQHL